MKKRKPCNEVSLTFCRCKVVPRGGVGSVLMGTSPEDASSTWEWHRVADLSAMMNTEVEEVVECKR